MDRRHVGVLSGVLGILGLVIQYVPSLLLKRWVDGGFEGPFPVIGTVGQTVTTYNLLIDITGPLITLVLAVGFGYYIAGQVDIAYEYRWVVRTIAIGSVVGVTLGATPMLFEGTVTPIDGYSIFLLLAFFLSMLVSVALVITVGAFAGAALCHFQTSDDSPPPPAEADTDSLSDSLSKSTDENSHTQTQPTR